MATKTIRQGQVIIRDRALLILKKSQIRDKRSVLFNQFKALSAKDQKTVLSLHHEDKAAASVEDKILDVFESNGIEVVPADSICLYSTIPRLNHSCSPLVVWSWLSGAATSKEVRAIRDIQPGEELTANYIDSFEATWSTRVDRQKRLSLWNFSCQCEVCSLEGEELKTNDKIREQISLQHQLVPKYMQTWNIDKALAAAQKKMELMKILKKEMMTLMPSTLMELYEMYRIAATLGIDVPQNIEVYKEDALVLSQQFGDRFLKVFHEKLSQIEVECEQIRKTKK